jgi:hypothetical protein
MLQIIFGGKFIIWSLFVLITPALSHSPLWDVREWITFWKILNFCTIHFFCGCRTLRYYNMTLLMHRKE